jgi:hypothetical protein
MWYLLVAPVICIADYWLEAWYLLTSVRGRFLVRNCLK